MLTYKDYLVKSPTKKYSTVYAMIKDVCSIYKDKTVFQMKTKENTYRKISYSDFWEISDAIAKFLKSKKVTSTSKIGILSENRTEWGIAYLSIMKTGATIVPIDAQINFQDLQFILKHSGTSIIFISKSKYNSLLKKELKKCSMIKTIIIFDNMKTNNRKILQWKDVIKKGEKLKIKLNTKITPDKIIEILYTSGTTGNPKAVMLTQKNIMADINGVLQMVELKSSDVFLSLLPIHHVFECTTGFLLPLVNGSTITYAESFKSKNIINNIKETNVTIILGVPLLFEKLYFGILRGVKEKPASVRLMFTTMLFIVRLLKLLFNINTGKVIFKGLRKKAGMSSLRLLISGGGPLPYIVGKGFNELGFTLIQGYGLSETSPVLTVGTEKYNNQKSVGLPIPGVKIKINNPDKKGIGEIIAKGPVIMKGYYKNPKATKEVLKKGWFHTGDAGYIDKKGFVYITGRIKNVIVTHGGKNVFPEELEEKLNLHPYVKESMVYGEPISEKIKGEKVKALIVPDYDFLKEEWKKIKNSSPTDEEVKKEIEKIINKINEKLPAYKKITEWVIQKEELIKTSTKKVKRFLYKKKNK